jgi:hypothetical protein
LPTTAYPSSAGRAANARGCDWSVHAAAFSRAREQGNAGVRRLKGRPRRLRILRRVWHHANWGIDIPAYAAWFGPAGVNSALPQFLQRASDRRADVFAALGEKDSMSREQFRLDTRLAFSKRTRAHVTTRSSPQSSEAEMDRGLLIFLSQLATVLRDEQRDPAQNGAANRCVKAHIERGATLHGQNLRKCELTIEQLIHAYGDVCRAVTELSGGEDATLTIAEFHTLDRRLDDAIAGAVGLWSEERDTSLLQSEEGTDSLREFSSLFGTAIVSFDALQAGRVGSGGITAAVFRNCLVEMRFHLDDPKRVTQ